VIHGNQSSPKSFGKLGVLAIAAIAGAAYWAYGDAISLESLAAQESSLRDFQVSHPILVSIVALGIYVAVTGFSLPGAAVLTLAFGWYFGWPQALVLVSFASTVGATVAFLLSRTLLRDSIEQRFGDRLESFNDSLRREGAFYLFTLRLIPAVPFFVINVVMGLTPMKARTFWWVSQLGMLPGTLVYVYTGSTFPTLRAIAENGPAGIVTAPMLAGFVALGLFPLIAKRVIRFFKEQKESRQPDALPTA
ncbi:MAG: TVP38/TMEM64 family protein, partial [Planctomycetota bacterium]